MKPLLIKKRKSTTQVKRGPDNGLMNELSKACIRCQAVCATWINKRAAHLSKKKLLTFLTIFIILSAGYSGRLIVNGFNGKSKPVVRVTSINMPKGVLKTGDEKQPHFLNLNGEEYQRIQRFQNYMDSLKRNPESKAVFDSILLIHPRLIDSIYRLEKIYQR